MAASFADKKTIAELTAKMLLEIEAIKFYDQKPYIFTSGLASPVYTDCRRPMSFAFSHFGFEAERAICTAVQRREQSWQRDGNERMVRDGYKKGFPPSVAQNRSAGGRCQGGAKARRH